MDGRETQVKRVMNCPLNEAEEENVPMIYKTVSEINTFLVCPQLWHHQYVSNRVPRIEPVALTGGKLWHKFIEGVHTTGIDPAMQLGTLELEAENAITDLRVAGREHAADELENTWEIMRQAAPHYEEQFAGGQTLAVEQALEASIGVIEGETIYLQGIPDRIKLRNGMITHVQTRTLSPSTPLTAYLKAAQRNLHELAYSRLITHAYPEAPYLGSEMQILLKAKLWSDRKCSRAGTKWHTERSRPDCDECHYEGRVREMLRQPSEIMSQTIVPIDGGQARRAMFDVLQIVGRMLEIERGQATPYQNRQADLGKFGNKLCPFFGVCNGEDDLTDEELFKNRESRYEDRDAEVMT